VLQPLAEIIRHKQDEKLKDLSAEANKTFNISILITRLTEAKSSDSGGQMK
jgi:hypothetical protein